MYTYKPIWEAYDQSATKGQFIHFFQEYVASGSTAIIATDLSCYILRLLPYTVSTV